MPITRRLITRAAVAVAAAAALLPQAYAQEVTLRLHHFLPAQANVPTKALAVWAQKVEKESNGRIKINLFPSMQLGGKPPELYDQAKDGVVDIVWTVLGYTPGRFPKTEAFELPFTVGDAEGGSRALWDYVSKFGAEEFKDVHRIANHVHGPGMFHTKSPITKVEDLKGMKIRGGSRPVNLLLEQLGATPVGLPVTQVGEALSKGVIDGTTIPWEVVPSIRVHQFVKNHTSFAGSQALYNIAFVLAMNKAAYEKLSPDNKKVIDANSGPETSAFIGRVQEESDAAARDLVKAAGNNIVVLNEFETQRFKRAASGVRAQWYQLLAQKGLDGQKLASEADALIAKYNKKK
jgi:TRAP-type C4-dicarboxylate transport system substrate-binding protein